MGNGQVKQSSVSLGRQCVGVTQIEPLLVDKNTVARIVHKGRRARVVPLVVDRGRVRKELIY